MVQPNFSDSLEPEFQSKQASNEFPAPDSGIVLNSHEFRGMQDALSAAKEEVLLLKEELLRSQESIMQSQRANLKLKEELATSKAALQLTTSMMATLKESDSNLRKDILILQETVAAMQHGMEF